VGQFKFMGHCGYARALLRGAERVFARRSSKGQDGGQGGERLREGRSGNSGREREQSGFLGERHKQEQFSLFDCKAFLSTVSRQLAPDIARRSLRTGSTNRAHNVIAPRAGHTRMQNAQYENAECASK
jgi:hypothetical protein